MFRGNATLLYSEDFFFMEECKLNRFRTEDERVAGLKHPSK